MRINLEGVRRRREDQIDRIRFGDDYSHSFARQAESPLAKVSKTRSFKWVWQSSLAVLLVVATVSLQQMSSPWAKSSVAFIEEAVERDYNWQGVLAALPDNGLFNWNSGITAPTLSSADPNMYNEYGSKFPSDSNTAPVFNPVTEEIPINSEQYTTSDSPLPVEESSLKLPLTGLLVKKFTDDKPYIEYIAFENRDVVAVTSGVVKQIGVNEKDEMLIHVEGDDFTHVYGRVTDILVKEGDVIQQGQNLAKVDENEGVALLLFQIIKDNQAIDPEALLPR